MLYRYHQAGPGAWGSAQAMGAHWPDTVPPVVVANQSGLLSAFLVGNNGQLYRYDQAASGAWGPTSSSGGIKRDAATPGYVRDGSTTPPLPAQQTDGVAGPRASVLGSGLRPAAMTWYLLGRPC